MAKTTTRKDKENLIRNVITGKQTLTDLAPGRTIVAIYTGKTWEILGAKMNDKQFKKWIKENVRSKDRLIQFRPQEGCEPIIEGGENESLIMLPHNKRGEMSPPVGNVILYNGQNKLNNGQQGTKQCSITPEDIKGKDEAKIKQEKASSYNNTEQPKFLNEPKTEFAEYVVVETKPLERTVTKGRIWKTGEDN